MKIISSERKRLAEIVTRLYSRVAGARCVGSLENVSWGSRLDCISYTLHSGEMVNLLLLKEENIEYRYVNSETLKYVYVQEYPRWFVDTSISALEHLLASLESAVLGFAEEYALFGTIKDVPIELSKRREDGFSIAACVLERMATSSLDSYLSEYMFEEVSVEDIQDADMDVIYDAVSDVFNYLNTVEAAETLLTDVIVSEANTNLFLGETMQKRAECFTEMSAKVGAIKLLESEGTEVTADELRRNLEDILGEDDGNYEMPRLEAIVNGVYYEGRNYPSEEQLSRIKSFKYFSKWA